MFSCIDHFLEDPTKLIVITLLNPLTQESDWELISSYNITPQSNIKVARIKNMINNKRNSWFLDKFSTSAP